MSKGKAVSYQDEKTREEEVSDDLADRKHTENGHWRLPYGLIILFCVLFLIVGFGGGFGAGWAARPEKSHYSSPELISKSINGTANVEYVDIIRPYVPIDPTQNLSNAVVEQYYYQTLVLGPALQVLTLVMTAFSGNNKTYDPQVLRIYVQNRYRTNQDTLAKLYNVAQRLQISPDFHKQIYNLSSSFVDVFTYIRNNESKIGAGRRLMASSSNTPAIQLFKAFVKAGLQAPALQAALGDLTPIWSDVDVIVDLVVDMLDAIRDIAAQTDGLDAAMANYHPTLYAEPEPAPMRIQGFNNKTLLVTVLPNLPLQLVVEDEEEEDAATKQPSGRRLMQVPDSFVPAPAASIPNVLIPLVWHFTMYPDSSRYGPPGIELACDMAQRMVTVANFRLMPSKFQLFISECRNTPNNAYLVSPSREAWLACTADGYYYNGCGAAIDESIVDFPRAINIYVSGEQPPLEACGYAFVPGSVTNPRRGHIGLSWNTVNTIGANNQKSYESGANSLVHEVMHHLGMDHTFSESSCQDADSGSGVVDTPATFQPVWRQTWAMRAAMGCMSAFRALGSDYERANQAAAVRLGIPPADANVLFDSCPGLPGPDETANYITYTYDLCLLSLGHFTTGQVAAMHQTTASRNPQLYTWGQYLATRPPAGAVTIASPPPSPPPPSPPPPPIMSPSPPPPPPAASPVQQGSSRISFTPVCRTITTSGCLCLARWNVNGGPSLYSDCTTTSEFPRRGNICAVDQTSGNCAGRNSWWDTCTPACGGGSSATGNSLGGEGAAAASPPPPSPPPPPPPSPPPPTVNCGAGAVARSGNTCSSRWMMTGGTVYFAGCANPNNNINGPWCALANGVRLASGAGWDYCDPACANVEPVIVGTVIAEPPPQPAYPASRNCTTTVITAPGVTDACSCSELYTITFAGNGTTYSRMQGCTAFAETGGQGMCVLACKRATNLNHGKAVTCTCA